MVRQKNGNNDKETREMNLKLKFSLSDVFENWSGTKPGPFPRKKKKNTKIILIYFPSSEN